MYLCYRGYQAALKRSAMEKPFITALGVFFLLYWGVHSLWLSIDSRYFFPILPFALFFLILGVQSTLGPLLKNQRIWVGLALIWAGLFMGETALVGRILLDDLGREMPRETFQWIHEHIPSNQMVLGIEPLLYLYTGRRGETGIMAVDSEDFRFQLLEKRISYVILLPFRANMPLAVKSNDSNFILARIAYGLSGQGFSTRLYKRSRAVRCLSCLGGSYISTGLSFVCIGCTGYAAVTSF